LCSSLYSDILSVVDRRWDLVVFGIIANICLGTVYSWSVFREPLIQSYGFSTGQTGIPYSVFLGAFAFSMPLGGRFLGRFGPRVAMATGALLVGIGWITAGMVSTIPALSITYGIIGGIGVGFSYGVPLAVVGGWFPGRRGFAVGLTLVGFGLSPFVTAPLAEILIERFGISSSFVILGVSFIIILLTVSLVMQRLPVSPVSSGFSDGPGDAGPSRMIRRREFLGLWITFALGTFAGLTTIGMSAAYAIEVMSMRPRAAAAAVSAFGVCNGVGRPLFGWITDRIGSRRAALVAFAAIAFGSTVVLSAGSTSVLAYLVGFGVLWMLLGGWLAIAPVTTVHFFGTHHYAANYGIVYTAYGVGALSGGAVSGTLTALTGTLSSTFFATIGAAVLGIVMALLFLPRHR
jgi:MFS transporter, OFA family, oxalate/formate antiporter